MVANLAFLKAARWALVMAEYLASYLVACWASMKVVHLGFLKAACWALVMAECLVAKWVSI